MHKKLILACLALVAFAAMAVPTVASAANTLTKEGKVVATGTTITATNSGSTLFTGVEPTATVTCTNSTMTGKVVKNNSETLEGTIESAVFNNGTGVPCTSAVLGNVTVTIPGLKAGTAHWCIRTNKTADAFELVGANCGGVAGGAPLTFILDTNVGECHYLRSTALAGTFTTNTTPVPLTLTAGQAFTRQNTNALCPKSGSIDAKYTLSEGGTGLTIS